MAGALFSQTPVLQSPEPTATVVETYRPPPPVETLQAEEGWTETQENLMESISSWKPLKEVSQEDLDRTLGPALTQYLVQETETPSQGLSEEE